MPLAGRILLSQLIADIKVEARVNGDDNLNITILAIINELLLAEVETSRYSWLVKEGAPIVAVAGQGRYPLPEDFLNMKAVYYGRAAEGTAEAGRILREKNDFVERSRDGIEPRFYEITGEQISIFPYGGVLNSDLIAIDYWAQPNALLETDTFPNAKLLTIIKRKTIARVHTINKDFNASDRLDKSGQEQQARSMTSEDNGDTQ